MKSKRPLSREVLPLLNDYLEQPGNAMGGSLSLFVDQAHCSVADISFCKQWALDIDDGWAVRLCDILLLMTLTQRTKIQKDLAAGRFMRIASALARAEKVEKVEKEISPEFTTDELVKMAHKAGF